YDAANQLLEAGKTALRWDDRGNLLEVSGPEGTQRFRYNARNQMVTSVADDGTETAYTYDALGRRTSKRTGAVENRFYWAGEQMLCEIRADLATGVLRRQDFLYHPETGVPLATAVDGEVYTIHTDHLGTPRALTSGTGEVVWLAELSSYGVARVVVEQVRMPLRFRGQYYDAETGLHYNRFRYYAPQWGRYISRDPLTFLAGMNHYMYVDGNPLNETDPKGLIGWKGIAALAAGAVVGIAVGIVLAPIALPLAIIAGGIAAGAVAGGLNEALNEKQFCLLCIAEAAGLGALAGAAGALPFSALPVGAGLLAFMGAGALGGALSYGVNCLDGAEKDPSWTGLGTSVLLGGASAGIGKDIGDAVGGTSPASAAGGGVGSTATS
ncbi:MAG: RHS repeat domain-containing protein, partial [Janthinobacterium lividum]